MVEVISWSDKRHHRLWIKPLADIYNDRLSYEFKSILSIGFTKMTDVVFSLTATVDKTLGKSQNMDLREDSCRVEFS